MIKRRGDHEGEERRQHELVKKEKMTCVFVCLKRVALGNYQIRINRS